MTESALVFVVPILRDSAAFLILRDRVREIAPPSAGTSPRFVVVDDSAGTDESVAGLRALDDVDVLDPPFNLGHQRAIVYALRRIAPELGDTDIVVTIDGDGEDRPEDVPRLLAPVLDDHSGHFISLALRTQRRETLLFKVAYVVFRLVFRALTGEVIKTGNFAAYRGRLIKRIIGHPYFDMSYSSTLISLQVPRVMIPCPRGERYAGHSQMNAARLVTHALGMLMPFTERIAVRALIAFSTMIALSGVAAVVVLGIRLFTEAAVPGWATYTLLFLLALSVVSLGNFVVLFSVFSQTRAMSFARLHAFDGRSREASQSAGG